MKPEQFRTGIEGVTGIVTAVSGLALALVAYSDSLQKILGVFQKAPGWAFWGAAGLLIILGVWFLAAARTKRSVLLRPEALRLDPGDPAHLVGREDDVDLLKNACLDHPLVFLSGELGAGKSALVQAGLIPALNEDKRLLPLYVSIWGQDWERGPAGALADALWHDLEESERAALKLSAPPESPQLFEVLKSARQTLGHTPLLVFDQFDDYQARHRERFLKRKSWLSAKALTDQNVFWRQIANLLLPDIVHCLFVTRADTADGLEAVRFREPTSFRLDRLRTTFVGELLDRLTAPAEGKNPVIDQPERGWQGLRTRLARDLDRDGFVLPQQLKTVLSGLSSLRSLTVSQYERAGGAAGVEALYVEGQVRSAARKTVLAEAAVRKLLLAMVESETQAKTVVRTLPELQAALAGEGVADTSATGRSASLANAALEELTKAELVRERTDPDTRQRAWLLDHDYLAGPVVEIERRANRWQTLLEDGARAFQEAGSSIVRRWRALLRAGPQIQLLLARLRGRFRYGQHRAYARWSALRFAPLALALVLGGFAWRGYEHWQETEVARSKANQILVALGELRDQDLSEVQISALWDLATAEETIRDQFLTQLLTSDQHAARFVHQPGPVVRALVGLDPDRRERTRSQLALYLSDKKVSISKAAARIAIELDAPGVLDASRLPELFDADEIPQVAAKLTGEQAARAVEPVLAAMKENTDPFALGALGQGLAALAGKLTGEQAARAVEPVLAAMKENTNPFALRALGQGLAALPVQLTGEQAARAVEPVLAAMKENTEPFALGALGQGLAALAGKLSLQRARLVGLAAETVVAWTGDLGVVETYTDVLAGLADQLGQDGFTSLAVDVLKCPMSPGKPTGTLLDKLQAMHPGAPKFDGDVWKAVTYAEEKKWPVNLRPTPERPPKTWPAEEDGQSRAPPPKLAGVK